MYDFDENHHDPRSYPPLQNPDSNNFYNSDTAIRLGNYNVKAVHRPCGGFMDWIVDRVPDNPSIKRTYLH